MITNNQNKAPQTLAVRGYADNALEAALSEVLEFCHQYARACARGVIIAKNFKKLQIIIAKNSSKPVIYSDNLLGFGVDVGYSCGSKNLGSTQRLYRCFFVPLIIVACHLTRCAFFYGGVWQAQAPRRPRRLEHPHPYTVAFQSKNLGGSHA